MVTLLIVLLLSQEGLKLLLKQLLLLLVLGIRIAEAGVAVASAGPHQLQLLLDGDSC